MEISQRQAAVCAALSDYHRVLLLYAVASEPRSVGDLVHRLGMSQPAVSHHLRILREQNLVMTERRGKSVYYFPADPRIIEAMDLMRTILTEQMHEQGTTATNAATRPPV
jgi:ArsR family transcriptional regulator